MNRIHETVRKIENANARLITDACRRAINDPSTGNLPWIVLAAMNERFEGVSLNDTFEATPVAKKPGLKAATEAALGYFSPERFPTLSASELGVGIVQNSMRVAFDAEDLSDEQRNLFSIASPAELAVYFNHLALSSTTVDGGEYRVRDMACSVNFGASTDGATLKNVLVCSATAPVTTKVLQSIAKYGEGGISDKTESSKLNRAWAAYGNQHWQQGQQANAN